MSFSLAFPNSLTLESSRVKLRLLAKDDVADFYPLSKSAGIWKFFTKDLSQDEELEQWVADALEDKRLEKRFPFTIIEKSTGAICGSTSLGTISFYDKRVEIGWTWVGEMYMGTGINTHAKYLLLQFAFETLHFKRVEIKTDNLNERAKKALTKIGAKPEGILRSHMQMFNNRRRDSIYYSILDSEWSQIRDTVFANIKTDR